MKKITFLVFFLLYYSLNAQTTLCTLEKDSVNTRLYSIIQTLAHDSLKGREAGSEEELKAALFIKNKFLEIGLLSVLKDSAYLQQFEITDGIKLNDQNYLNINGKTYSLMNDFHPLNSSGNGKVSGEIIRVGWGVQDKNSGYDDYDFYLNDHQGKELKNKIFAIELGAPPAFKDKKNNFDNIDAKIKLATEKGAAAVIFIRSDDDLTKPTFEKSRFEQPVSIPVIFADQTAYKTIMDSNAPMAEISVNIQKDIKNAYNVVGYLDNNAPYTVVIGAHYDHLGMGGPISRHKGPPDVHHGADDNASGVATIIELARTLKCKGFSKYNFCFVAFSAEEKGLIGSNYFAKNETIKHNKINFMLNIDMVGRIDTAENKLSLIGTGSSPLWDSILNFKTDSVVIVKGNQVTGGSDHASFYFYNIPVIFFFSGLHDDYHKPSDLPEKINVNGIYYTLNFLYNIIERSSGYDKLPFARASAELSGAKRNSSVTLGVIPDHAYNGVGLRISDVTEDKPAAKAGIIKGDIICKIDDNEIRDIYAYMNILKLYKKGDKAVITLTRDSKNITVNIIF
ncbi:MAG: Aminopeptidase YwaD precursor [Bacteroidetes bacterium ADurb.Bin408]|nr:MAG: Aminopeptidase YwaD precursor [Bacteroidetes bacterium ADurb.Bin408]